MAIRMMTSKEEFGVNPKVEKVTTGYGSEEQPLFMETSHEGCVLAQYERNGYDDSDFYAIVWNDEKQEIQHIQYATTRGWTYPNGCWIDATEEFKEKANQYLKQQAFKRWQEDNKQQAAYPEFGKQVTVVKGRKVPIGTTGEVCWFGKDQFARTSRYRSQLAVSLGFFKYDLDDKRVGIRLKDGTKVFTAATNVQVDNPDQYLKPDSAFVWHNNGYQSL